MADKFNDYSVNIGLQLSDKIPKLTGDPCQYMRGDFPNNMAIWETDYTELVKTVHNLKSSPSRGYAFYHKKCYWKYCNTFNYQFSLSFNRPWEKKFNNNIIAIDNQANK